MPLENSLVLYKNRPARVTRAGEKLTIEQDNGETAHVRPKDVATLHPGPLRDLKELRPQNGEVEAAWEILAGSHTTLPELAELIYGSFTPASAWAAWQLVADGIYFRGSVEDVVAGTAEEVARRLAMRTAGAAEREAWQDFVGRVRAGRFVDEDLRYLKDVENAALGRMASSRVLRELGREDSPENAHALLLELGYWDVMVDPYPVRLGLPAAAPESDVPALPREERVDLTELPAYAIDDEDTDTPDDAISFVPDPPTGGGRLWVHVADAAAIAPSDSQLDLEARARGATTYLPEGNVPMLPPQAIKLLGLGLNELSPALSFALDMDAGGEVTACAVMPSRLRVTRLTYEEADGQLQDASWDALRRLTEAHRTARLARGAISIEFPETKVRIRDGQVSVRPILALPSRALVEEAMIIAGEAAAQFAVTHGLRMPFATQEAPDAANGDGHPTTLSGMFALRRTLKHSQYRTGPAAHAGLGLPAYVQVTSPLRRYLDLVAHQQLRAHLRGEPALDEQAMIERVGAAEAALGSVRQADRLAMRHWTLVYLMQQGQWTGQGILIDKRGLNGTVLVPELAFETHLHLPDDLPLDAELGLSLRDVDLPRLDARFRVGIT